MSWSRPTFTFPDYVEALRSALDTAIAGHSAQIAAFDHRPYSRYHGYLAGEIAWPEGHRLFFREFVDLQQPAPRLMYAYHLQDSRNELVFRYDNAPHRPPLSPPEHKHTPTRTVAAAGPTLGEVVDEALKGLTVTPNPPTPGSTRTASAGRNT